MRQHASWATEFPQTPGLIYLNHAAVAPWPQRAAQAVCRFAAENVAQGAADYPRWASQEKHLREQLRQLLNAPSSEDIALVKNTSEALSFVAAGLDWHQGDEVLISDQEFPSNRIVWEALAPQGVTLRRESLSVDDPEAALINAMGPRTRLLSISSVQYASGVRLDLQRLGQACRQRGILFCVDAIQSLGAHHFDVQQIDCDFAMADGHKWLLGPEGLGVFYCRAERREQLKPSQFGWHMVEAMGDYDREDWTAAASARRYEPGSPNMLAQQALSASLGLLLETGMTEVEAALAERIDWLHQALARQPGLRLLSPAEPERRAGILTFHLEGVDHVALVQRLRQQQLVCAARGGGLRWSPHFYTPAEQLEQALVVLERCVQTPG